MSEIDILVTMATDFSNLRLSLEKVLQFAENVLPNYINFKFASLILKHCKVFTIIQITFAMVSTENMIFQLILVNLCNK